MLWYCIQSTQIRGKTTIAGFFVCFFLSLQMCLLGVDSCPCGGRTIYVSGRRWQLVFPAYSGGLKYESPPSYQEPQSPTSAVGQHGVSVNKVIIVSLWVNVACVRLSVIVLS